MPIYMYGKTFKNLLLQNQKSYDLETWHVTLGTRALQRLYINDDPGLTLTYFMARSNWVTCTFEWGKLLQSHLMEEKLPLRTILTEYEGCPESFKTVFIKTKPLTNNLIFIL